MARLFFLIPAMALLLVQTGIAQEKERDTKTTPVALKKVDGKTVCQLAPENTAIEFVGTHVGDDPKPRLGGFKTFAGQFQVSDGKPTALQVEMEIGSIWTEFDNLTKHLMNEDFFEVTQFPKSSFQSSKINDLGGGNCIIEGELTLHGVASKIEFPAKYKVTDQGMLLTSEFTLDRTQFGMDKMTDGVEAVVTLNVSVGKPTRGVKSKGGNGSDKSNEQAQMDDPAIEGQTITISLPAMT